MPDVRDRRQRDVRQKHSLMPPPIRGRGITISPGRNTFHCNSTFTKSGNKHVTSSKQALYLALYIIVLIQLLRVTNRKEVAGVGLVSDRTPDVPE